VTKAEDIEGSFEDITGDRRYRISDNRYQITGNSEVELWRVDWNAEFADEKRCKSERV
jgi:hypothetical protein